jgi:uncharacterized protein (TIGR04255 family)
MTAQKPVGLTEYRTPPVVEVVLGTAFQPLQRLGIVELVDIWREHFALLTEVEEQPRVELPIERFDVPEVPPISFEMLPSAPVPRLYFHDREGTQLVQLQNDWFARNWRKLQTSADYPRYPALRAAFEADLRHLADYIQTKDLGDIIPTQCEITYINHIPVEDVASAITLVNDARRSSMPEAEGTHLATQFVITTGHDRVGRLHLQARSGRSKASGEPVVVLTITARGKPLGEGIDGLLAMLDLGREWCNRAFDNVTRPEMQERWGKSHGH